MKTTPWCVATVAVVLLATQRAWADGCFIKTTDLGQSKSLVTSPKQEAILATDGQTVQVILRTHFNAGPKELGWVVPVPGVPDDVRKVDDAIFDRLEAMSVPSFTKCEENLPEGDGEGPPFGCYSRQLSTGAFHGVAMRDVSLAVRVEKVGVAGIFDFQVVSSERVEDLLQWLEQHNYSPPEGAARAFAPYVAKKWHWLVVRVRAEEASRSTLCAAPNHVLLQEPSSGFSADHLLVVGRRRDRDCSVRGGPGLLWARQLDQLHLPRYRRLGSRFSPRRTKRLAQRHQL